MHTQIKGKSIGVVTNVPRIQKAIAVLQVVQVSLKGF